jgi:hypothetical protein
MPPIANGIHVQHSKDDNSASSRFPTGDKVFVKETNTILIVCQTSTLVSRGEQLGFGEWVNG